MWLCLCLFAGVLDAGGAAFVGPAGHRVAKMAGEDHVRDLVRQDRVEEPLGRALDRHPPAVDFAPIEDEGGGPAGPQVRLPPGPSSRRAPTSRAWSCPARKWPSRGGVFRRLADLVAELGIGGFHHEIGRDEMCAHRNHQRDQQQCSANHEQSLLAGGRPKSAFFADLCVHPCSQGAAVGPFRRPLIYYLPRKPQIPVFMHYGGELRNHESPKERKSEEREDGISGVSWRVSPHHPAAHDTCGACGRVFSGRVRAGGRPGCDFHRRIASHGGCSDVPPPPAAAVRPDRLPR